MLDGGAGCLVQNLISEVQDVPKRRGGILMREIKFRSWDKECRFMCSSHGQIRLDGKLLLHKGYDDIENTCYILMQYIGLKDDDNNDIYEGDIVEVIEDGESSMHEVVYRSDFDYPAFDLMPSLYVDCNGISYAIAHRDCKMKVIGNIYEYLELLNASQDGELKS